MVLHLLFLLELLLSLIHFIIHNELKFHPNLKPGLFFLFYIFLYLKLKYLLLYFGNAILSLFFYIIFSSGGEITLEYNRLYIVIKK